MERYDRGDIATFYFIINDDGKNKAIRAWTDKKQLAEIYLDFHKCPNYRLKKVTKCIDEINEILDENNNDEIVIGNIYMKDPDRKKGNVKIVSIPVTQVEITFINEECETFLSSRINYSYLNGVIPYLKKKYREALTDIFLPSIIKKVVYNKNDMINQDIKFDQLMVLFRSFPDDFGM